MSQSDNVSPYRVTVSLPYLQAVDRVVNALKEQGFGVLTEVDVKATLKKKLNVDFRRYVILGACNPPLAYRALTTELEIGLHLPCNAIVYEVEGGSVVSVVNPLEMIDMVDNSDLAAVAEEAGRRLRRVIEIVSLADTAS